MRIECGGYAYSCNEDVKVGDTVLVSVSSGWDNVFGRTAERTVTSMTTDYNGPCEAVLRVLKQKETQ